MTLLQLKKIVKYLEDKNVTLTAKISVASPAHADAVRFFVDEYEIVTNCLNLTDVMVSRTDIENI